MIRSRVDVYKAKPFLFCLPKPEAVDSGRIRTRRKSIPSDERKKELVEPVPSGTRTAAGAGRKREPIQQTSLFFKTRRVLPGLF
ncbi:hypothetical protein C6I21_04355 [Alkalicoccus urumqiensis]|uniref:Uncharacterized protein n=1 Tax=Alkalicoccus urumqiensis TaxID=1548213 RepID=A0A2P6MJW2_ALKUR|nr:hypothetical protein C6I21_04355 [Alkalicoccus urumqiensis]